MGLYGYGLVLVGLSILTPLIIYINFLNYKTYLSTKTV